MMKLKAEKLLELGFLIQVANDTLEIGSDEDGPEKQQQRLRAFMTQIHGLCRELEMEASAGLVERSIEDLPQTAREVVLLNRAIEQELKSKVFMYVPPHKATYFDSDTLLSELALKTFPGAASELRQAGNAYATGFHTASVFHSMRGAELGTRALAQELGVSFPFPLEQAELHPLLEQCESKIAAMKNLPKSAQKADDMTFYSQAAAQFRYFKDAWRVRVAHARATYTEGEARSIMLHTAEFFDVIALRIKE